ncbi:MAG: glycosyltransferase [Planctomycetota bacterium]|nr:glycosyltransferase [Planctomycetota bacterium]
MRILICHNFYQQGGGEDQVFAAEADLLRRYGHDVETYAVHNDEIAGMGKIALAGATIWNRKAAGEVSSRARKHRAQIVHFHNTFPLLSPAVYWAARNQGAAVVQTLHNYRLICPAATMFREGKPCEECLGRLPLPAIAHACYRDSRIASAAATAMLSAHRMLGTYCHAVDAYIVLTKFAADKFIQAGFAPESIHLKPNFIDPDPGAGLGDGGFALFVGRLTPEKGIQPMLAAWRIIAQALPLKICGDGPLGDVVAAEPGVEWLGRRPFPEIIELMGRATVLVFPSLWYEGFPRTIVESLARGTPVAASDLGSMTELIVAGKTGVLFRPGDAQDMAQKILHLVGNGPELSALRPKCRQEFLDRYNAAENHSRMMEIYNMALARRADSTGARAAAEEADVDSRADGLAAG